MIGAVPEREVIGAVPGAWDDVVLLKPMPVELDKVPLAAAVLLVNDGVGVAPTSRA